MPATETVLFRTLRSIKNQIGELEDHYSLEKAFNESRKIIRDIPFTFDKLHVPIAVWLLKHFTGRDPQVVTIIDLLDFNRLMPSQSATAAAISSYLRYPKPGKRGILVKKDDGDSLSLNYSLLKKIDY